MLSIPSVSTMLTVIGVALLITTVLTAAVSYLLDRLTRQTATAIVHDATGAPARPAVTLPGQRTATHSAHSHAAAH